MKQRAFLQKLLKDSVKYLRLQKHSCGHVERDEPELIKRGSIAKREFAISRGRFRPTPVLNHRSKTTTGAVGL